MFLILIFLISLFSLSAPAQSSNTLTRNLERSLQRIQWPTYAVTLPIESSSAETLSCVGKRKRDDCRDETLQKHKSRHVVFEPKQISFDPKLTITPITPTSAPLPAIVSNYHNRHVLHLLSAHRLSTESDLMHFLDTQSVSVVLDFMQAYRHSDTVDQNQKGIILAGLIGDRYIEPKFEKLNDFTKTQYLLIRAKIASRLFLRQQFDTFYNRFKVHCDVSHHGALIYFANRLCLSKDASQEREGIATLKLLADDGVTVPLLHRAEALISLGNARIGGDCGGHCYKRAADLLSGDLLSISCAAHELNTCATRQKYTKNKRIEGSKLLSKALIGCGNIACSHRNSLEGLGQFDKAYTVLKEEGLDTSSIEARIQKLKPYLFMKEARNKNVSSDDLLVQKWFGTVMVNQKRAA